MSGSHSAAPARQGGRAGHRNGSRGKRPAPSGTPRELRDLLAAPGHPIDLGVRREVEARLGYDFSRVRVHADRDAAALTRQRNEHLDPATLVDRLVAGLVRSLRGDPADASGRVRLQLARFTPQLRHDVLEKLEARLPSAEFIRVRQQAAEADAAPGDGAVDFAGTPAPVVEPDAEAEQERAAEDESRQADEEQRDQRGADANEEQAQERETEKRRADDEAEHDEEDKREAERDKAAEDEDSEAEKERDKEKSEKDEEEKDKAAEDEKAEEEKAADEEEKEKAKGEKKEKGETKEKAKGEKKAEKKGKEQGAPGTPPPAAAAPVAGPGVAADAAPVGAGGAEPVVAERVDEIAEDPNGPLVRHGIVGPQEAEEEPGAPPPPVRAEALPLEPESPESTAESLESTAETPERPAGPPPDLLPKTDLDVANVPTADEELRLPESGAPPRPREAPSFPAPPPLEPAAEEALAAEQEDATAAAAAGPDAGRNHPAVDRPAVDRPAVDRPGADLLAGPAPDGEAGEPERGPADGMLRPGGPGPEPMDLAGGPMDLAGGTTDLAGGPMDMAAGPGPAAVTAPGADTLGPGAPAIPQDASLEPGGGGCAGAPEPTTEEPGGGGCGGGGGAPAAEEQQPQEPAPPDVSGQEPPAALAATAQLPPHQMKTALGGVDQSVNRTVGEEQTALAEAPPEMDRPSGAPQTLHGPPDTAAPAESTVGKLERVTAEGAGGQQGAQGRDVGGRPLPASAVPSPNVAGTPGGDLTAEDVGNIEAAVDSVPTSDPALNNATVGPAPQVELTGQTDPALTDQQARRLNETSGKLAAIGRDDAGRPLGEDQVFPDVPPEMLRAKVPAPQPTAAGGAGPAGAGPGAGPGGPGAGPAGAPGPGGAAMKPVSVVAQQERGPQIQASVGEGQTQMSAGRQEKDQKSEQARQENRAQVAAAVQENVDAQAAERAGAKEEATGQRAQWRVEQDTLLADNGKQATEKHGAARADIQTEHDSKNAEISKEQENHNNSIAREREKAEKDARAEKEKAKKDEGGFWGWVKSKVKALFDKIVSAVKAVFEAARRAVQGLIDGFKKLATGLIEAARRAIVAAIRVLADALIAIADVLLAAFPGLRDKFRKFITDLRDRAINAVNALADKLKKGIEALLDLLAKGLMALLSLYEKALLAAVELVRAAVNKAIEFAQAAIAALGQLAALIADVAPDPVGWIKKLGSAAKEGIRSFLWTEIKIAVRQWFNEKVQGILGLGKMVFDVLVKGCMSIAQIGRMAWQAVVKALPMMIVSIVIEKLVSLIIPAAGAVLAIVQGLIAAYGTISRIIAAFAKFFAFLKAVKGVTGAACLFAQAVAAGVVALLEFITNFLLVRLGMALKGVATKLKGIAKKIADKLRRPPKRPGGRPGGAGGPGPRRPGRPGAAAAPRTQARPGARPGPHPAPRRPDRPGARPDPRRPDRPDARPDAQRRRQPDERPDPRRPRRPDDRAGPQRPRRPGDRPDRRPDRREPDRRPDRDKRKPQESKEARLARILARIRPRLARLLSRGVTGLVMPAVLLAMRAWYRLTALKREGDQAFTIQAYLNPRRPAGEGVEPDHAQLRRLVNGVVREVLRSREVKRRYLQMRRRLEAQVGIQVSEGPDYFAGAAAQRRAGRSVRPFREQRHHVGQDPDQVTVREFKMPGKTNAIVRQIDAYPAIANQLTASGLNDRLVARELRVFITTGRFKRNLTVGQRELLGRLSYLMVVREGARNPRSLAHAAMTLDLIASGQWTWQHALAEYKGQRTGNRGAFPMSMEGAARAARGLAAEDIRLPPSAVSGGTEAERRELEAREYELVEEWMMMKLATRRSLMAHSQNVIREYIRRLLLNFFMSS